MSYAWEITLEDVNTVLKEHGLTAKAVLNKALKKAISQSDRVEKAVLYYIRFDNQCNAALSEIEDILVEENIITDGKKLFDFKH